MDPQGFNTNSRLRASDADRDRAASVLSEALAEGRLTPEEHSERLDSIYAAKTQADLVPLLEDLPAAADSAVAGARRARANRPARRKDHRRVRRRVEERGLAGPAHQPGGDRVRRRRHRPAGRDLAGPEITIRAVSVFGGLSITVPPEMRVIDSGVAIFGGRDVSGESAESEAPDSPVLRLQGACVFGGVSVKHKQRKPNRR